ncbi:MAG: hypothetical protein AAF591_07230 [Verrucomicrobiota bacterium]
MKKLSLVSALFLAVTTVTAMSEDAQRLLKFFSYFEGTWELTDQDSGEKGTMIITLGAGGTSHILTLKLGDMERTELWGYNPATGKWMAAGFGNDGERFTQVMENVPGHERPRPGDQWLDRHEGTLPSGEKTSAQLAFTIDSEDQYTVVSTKIQIGDQSLPDNTLICTRKD